MIRQHAFILVILIFASLSHFSRLRFVEDDFKKPSETIGFYTSQPALDILSLTYRTLVADYYWLQALSHLGERSWFRYNYPNLEPLLKRVLALDPYFSYAYVFAGASLTLGVTQGPGALLPLQRSGKERRKRPKGYRKRTITLAQELLEQGVKHRPDVWKIGFILGFNYFYYVQDFKRAAEVLSEVAKIPGSPPQSAPLAMRLAAESKSPEIGLYLIDSLLPSVEDEEIKKEYLLRKDLLLLEQELLWLKKTTALYVKRTGKKPQKIEDLVASGLLKSLPPKDPLGGEYFIDENGEVVTTSDDDRLRLEERVKNELRMVKQ